MTESASPWIGYQEGLAAGELRFQRCGDCARAVFYPRVVCPHCGSTALAWEISSGAGTVYATTVMRPHRQEPYNVCLVDLDEGFRLMSRVDRVPADGVRIGDRLRLLKEAGTAPVFVPADRS
ncbi:MAG: OB-fold domain-containing protein [Actinobacteria bacterium]|nr:OB-fold domain-containing protein [Actinomycetota bacterium]